MSDLDTVVHSKAQRYDFFFYGTLCVPAILCRVLGHQCEGFTFQDALLPNYTRHCVKGEDYPAIIIRDETNRLIPKKEILLSKDVSTRGTIVRGLSVNDVNAIDVFEGKQYMRKRLPVQTLTEPARMYDLPVALTKPTTREPMDNIEAERYVESLKASTDSQKGAADSVEVIEGGVEVGLIDAWVYVWKDELSELSPDIWSFEIFMNDKAKIWMGASTAEYDDVDRHHALESLPGVQQHRASVSPEDEDAGDGDGSKIEGIKVDGFPEFGHNMLQYWNFAKNYINLNHGSYGSPPRVVIDAGRKMTDEIESCPDKFMRLSWLPHLDKARQQCASLIGARIDEIVIVPNATHGINTITGNIDWAEGDVIIIYSTTYGAVAQTVKCICDRNPGVSIEVVDVTFPCPKSLVVKNTESLLRNYNKPAIPSYTGESRPSGKSVYKRVRMVVLDSISSNPGILYPWEEIVGLCKKYGVLSLVDAAHSIGQIKTDVKKSDCDFWVSNCHKWLYGLRSAAVMYVPLRNQHLIRSSFPTAALYESKQYPTEGINRPWSFVRQYEWTGTQDWTPYFSITPAIAFRESIGGEDRIMRYCHTLAVQGGRRLAKKFGTPMMDNKQNDLTVAMVNVALPEIPEPENLEEQFSQLKYIQHGLYDRNCFAPAYWYAGRWWARFSAQVWNDLSDFDYLADAFSQICEGLRKGEHNEVEVEKTETIHRPEDLPTQDE